MGFLLSNSCSYKNQTETIDFFCTDLTFGSHIAIFFALPSVCLGLPACVWLLYQFVKQRHSNSIQNTYNLCLTTMDLFFNASVLPTIANFYIIKNEGFLWMVTFFFLAFNQCGRPLLTACICVDGVMAVTRPVFFLKIKNKRYRQIVSVFVWTTTTIYAVIIMVRHDIYWTIGVVPAFSVVAIAICNLLILHTLRKQDPSRRSSIHPQKQRALQIIINSLIITVVSYLPMLVLTTLFCLVDLDPQYLYCVFFIPSIGPPLLGSTIMPLLHSHNLGGFKNLKNWGWGKVG